MSDAFIKKYVPRHATERQKPVVEEEPKERSTSKKRVKKPWILWHKWSWTRGHLPSFLSQSAWHRWGRYKTKAEAEKVLQDQIRKTNGRHAAMGGRPDSGFEEDWKIEKE